MLQASVGISDEQLRRLRDQRLRFLLLVLAGVLIFGMGYVLLNERIINRPQITSGRTERIGWIGVAVGIGLLFTTLYRLNWGGYFFCFASLVIADLMVLQASLATSMVAFYPVIVVLGAVVLRGRSILLLGSFSLLNYVVVALALIYQWPWFDPQQMRIETNTLTYNVMAATIAIAITTLAMFFFARTLYNAVAASEERAAQLQAALSVVTASREVEEQTSTALTGVTTRLGAIGTRQLASATEQAAALAEVTVTMEELSQTAEQIAEAAGNVDQAAGVALTAVGNSQAAVNDSLQAMVMIRLQVQQIVDRTVALNQRIQQIGEVVAVVSSIAAEIHLLALNASIEAAGAGAAGERFNVVASEVKKLARRAQEQARQIAGLVQEVQRANSASVMATEQGLKETDKGTQQSRLAAEANLELIDSFSGATGQVRAIRLATQQQRSATQQVVETMRNVQDSAGAVAASSRELTTLLGQLNQLAEQLSADSK